MQPPPNIRVRIPPVIEKGKPFEVRAMIMHPMETGYRVTTQGVTIPLHTIDTFTCRFEGEMVFQAEMGPGLSANPYLSFFAKVDRSGVLQFTWVDMDKDVYTHEEKVTVT
jgi:sulfur-oxidizing protein SoxZ